MSEQRPNAGATPDAVIDRDLFEHLGEVVSMSESLVVSPSQGRFHRESLVEGAVVLAGTLIGVVAFNGGKALRVIAPADGVFLGWMAWEGESLQRGTPLARIGEPANGSNGNGHPPTHNGNGSR
jgi:hypothetical protein